MRSHLACFPAFQPNEERNVLEESAGFVSTGEVSEPEVSILAASSRREPLYENIGWQVLLI